MTTQTTIPTATEIITATRRAGWDPIRVRDKLTRLSIRQAGEEYVVWDSRLGRQDGPRYATVDSAVTALIEPSADWPT